MIFVVASTPATAYIILVLNRFHKPTKQMISKMFITDLEHLKLDRDSPIILHVQVNMQHSNSKH